MRRKLYNLPQLRRASERGTQLAELSLILPILLLLIAGVTEFGRYFYTYTTLAKATRAGARYLASRPYNSTETTKAQNLVVCGSVEACGSGTAILGGLTTANVQVTASGSSSSLPNTVTVRIVSYNYSSIFDLSRFIGGAAWTSKAVTPSTTMRYMVER